MSYVSVLNICIAVVIVMTIAVFIFGIVVSRNPEKQKPVIIAFVCNMVFLVAFLAVVIFARKQELAPLMAGLCAVLPLLSYFLSFILFKRRREGSKMQSAWGGYQAQGSSLEDLSEPRDAHLLTGFEMPQVDGTGEYATAQIPLSDIDKTQPLKPISAQDIAAATSAASGAVPNTAFSNTGISHAGAHTNIAQDPFFSDNAALSIGTTATPNTMNKKMGTASSLPTDTIYAKNSADGQEKDNSEIIAQAHACQKEQNYSKAAELYAQAAKMSTNSGQQGSLVLDEVICYIMAQQGDKAKKLAAELLNSKTLDANLAMQLKEVVDLMP